MNVRILLFLIASAFAGLFWSLGSNIHVVITHFVAPPAFAIAIAFGFRSSSWRFQLLLLALMLAVAEFVRLAVYSFVADGWHYIRTDGETQLVTLISIGVQCVIALLLLTSARFATRRYARNTS